MNKDGKNFNIPRGSNDEYEAIRQSLHRRIKDYEDTMPKQEVHDVPEQNNYQGNYQNPNMQGNSYSQYQQNPYQQQSQYPQQQSSYPQQQPRAYQQQAGYYQKQQPSSFQQQQSSYQQQQPRAYQQQQQLNQFRQQQPRPFQQNNSAQTNGPWATRTQQNQAFQNRHEIGNTRQKSASEVNVRGANQLQFASASHSNEPVVYKPKKRKSAGKTVVILFVMIALIFGLSWALREFVFQAYEIPSGSMEKTIMTGDMVFAEKVTYKVSKPKAGDIATFDDPLNPGRILIKRIIATEGQTIDIKNNKLFIDNVEQKEDYVNGLPTSALRSPTVSYPYTVPEGCIWVMGDNRTNSQDSRYFGAIPVDSVIGKALVVYWPISNAKNLG